MTIKVPETTYEILLLVKKEILILLNQFFVSKVEKSNIFDFEI